MEGHMILLLPVLVPILMGVSVMTLKGLKRNRQALVGTVLVSLVVSAALVFAALSAGGDLALWKLTDTITIAFHVDGVSRLFAALTGIVWLLVGIYSVSYMKHEE